MAVEPGEKSEQGSEAAEGKDCPEQVERQERVCWLVLLLSLLHEAEIEEKAAKIWYCKSAVTWMGKSITLKHNHSPRGRCQFIFIPEGRVFSTLCFHSVPLLLFKICGQEEKVSWRQRWALPPADHLSQPYGQPALSTQGVEYGGPSKSSMNWVVEDASPKASFLSL